MRRVTIVLITVVLVASAGLAVAGRDRPAPATDDLAFQPSAEAAAGMSPEAYEKAKLEWKKHQDALRAASIERGEEQRLDRPVCELRAEPWNPRIGGSHVKLPTFLQEMRREHGDLRAASACATINVTYTGFSAPAQAAFQYAVDIWSRLLASPVTINVNANFTPLGPGILGSAGSNSIWRDFGGAGFASTWYADALADQLAGGSLGGGAADINANFSSTFTWYFGTDGEAPPGTYDFVTVVLHELGHGLGFFGAGNGSAAAGTVRNAGFPTVYDQFVENGGGTSILTFPDPSVALGNELRGGDLFHDSPNSTAANGGVRPELYVPGAWNSGSSYSHWDDAVFPPGNIQSLMTHALGPQETIHQPGPATLGAFQDHGWAICPQQTPVNDLCVDALPLGCGQTVSGTSLGASEVGEPVCGVLAISGPGVWYEIVGTGGYVTLSTCNAASFDTKISVYSGGCGALTCVGGNDDACGARSSVTLSTTAGTPYLVYVHGFSGATGTFDLTFDGDTDGDGLCDDVDPDDDNDGVLDGPDPQPFNPDICGDSDIDGCDDCSVGTDDFGPLSDKLPANDGIDTDGDGQCNVGDTDDDNDGVLDGPDPQPLNPDICGDSDFDTCDDCTVGTDDFGPLSDQLPANDGLDTDGDGQCNAGDPDDDNDGVLDGPDPEPLNPYVCGLDDDGDTCDDCTVGVDGFGPLPDNDFTNDGPDGDGDGICDAGDRLWLSVLQLQWGFPTLYPQNVYDDPPLGGPTAPMVPPFLPNLINLDALDLMVLGGDFLFSVDRSGTAATPLGPVAVNEGDIFRYSGGVITTELSWLSEGVPVRGLNALDRLGPDLFAFSVNRQQIVRDGLGISRYLKPWQVFTYDRTTGAIALVLDAAPYGFSDVDGVDKLKDGRFAISNSTNRFIMLGGVPTFIRNQNAYIVDAPDLILAYDGGASGLRTLDAFTMIVPEAP